MGVGYRLVGASLTLAALGSAASAGAAPAATQAAVRDNHDLQCLIVTSKLAQSADDQAKFVGTMSALYFTGKVFALHPTIDLAAAVKVEVAKIKAANVDPLVKDCGGEIQTRGQQLEDVGKFLDTSAPAPSAAPPAR